MHVVWSYALLHTVGPDCSGKCAFIAKVLPKETVMEVGDDITFHCIFPEGRAMSVTWHGPSLQKEGPVLFLKNVNISSSGKYTCSVWNDTGIMANASAHLTVQSKLFYRCCILHVQ